MHDANQVEPASLTKWPLGGGEDGQSNCIPDQHVWLGLQLQTKQENHKFLSFWQEDIICNSSKTNCDFVRGKKLIWSNSVSSPKCYSYTKWAVGWTSHITEFDRLQFRPKFDFVQALARQMARLVGSLETHAPVKPALDCQLRNCSSWRS